MEKKKTALKRDLLRRSTKTIHTPISTSSNTNRHSRQYPRQKTHSHDYNGRSLRWDAYMSLLEERPQVLSRAEVATQLLTHHQTQNNGQGFDIVGLLQQTQAKRPLNILLVPDVLQHQVQLPFQYLGVLLDVVALEEGQGLDGLVVSLLGGEVVGSLWEPEEGGDEHGRDAEKADGEDAVGDVGSDAAGDEGTREDVDRDEGAEGATYLDVGDFGDVHGVGRVGHSDAHAEGYAGDVDDVDVLAEEDQNPAQDVEEAGE